MPKYLTVPLNPICRLKLELLPTMYVLKWKFSWYTNSGVKGSLHLILTNRHKPIPDWQTDRDHRVKGGDTSTAMCSSCQQRVRPLHVSWCRVPAVFWSVPWVFAVEVCAGRQTAAVLLLVGGHKGKGCAKSVARVSASRVLSPVHLLFCFFTLVIEHHQGLQLFQTAVIFELRSRSQMCCVTVGHLGS